MNSATSSVLRQRVCGMNVNFCSFANANYLSKRQPIRLFKVSLTVGKAFNKSEWLLWSHWIIVIHKYFHVFRCCILLSSMEEYAIDEDKTNPEIQ